MAKAKSRFVCRDCGAVYPKWQGQCHECGAWNTLEEEAAPVAAQAGTIPYTLTTMLTARVRAEVVNG